MTIHTLSDGTEIIESTQSNNRSGYTGAALSVSWTLDESHPFIAACGNPSDPAIMAQLRHRERTAWHGGAYADAREAAYVVARFKRDPVAVDREIARNGTWDNFPADLYKLPAGTAVADAVEILRLRRARVKIKPKTIQLDTSMPARGNLYKFFKRDQIVPLARAAGGPEQFQSSLDGLSILDFAAEHNLEI